jgi:hypothetical protein
MKTDEDVKVNKVIIKVNIDDKLRSKRLDIDYI